MFLAAKTGCLKVAALACLALTACSAASNDEASDPPQNQADSGVDASSIAPTPTLIPLKGCGVNYTADVTVGGSTAYTFVVDTGSSVTGVGGSSCASCVDGGVTPLYTPGPSATDTKKNTAENFANTSGWSGEIYEDKVSVGTDPALDLNFVDITTQNSFFPDLDARCNASISGILGLGPSTLLLAGTSSYLDERAQAGAPDVFSFQLCPTSGNLWLGGVDPSFAVQYTPMVSGQNFYTASLSSVDIAGTSLGLTSADLGDAFVDTGGDALWLPQNAFNAVTTALGKNAAFAQLFGSAQTFFSPDNGTCAPITKTAAELDAALPALTLTFGSGIVIQSSATSSYLFNELGCWMPGLFTRGANTQGLPPVELGAPILHNKVIVIDRAQQRIGFATAPCP